MLKKCLSVLLTIYMMISVLSVSSITVSAATIVDSGTRGDNLTWTLDDEGTLIISGTGDMRNYNWEFSPNYSPNPWWGWGNGCPIKKVVIQNGVTSIGDYAFYGCKDLLISVEIPDSVTCIGDYVFYNCVKLTDVYYGGSQSEWLTIQVGISNDYLKQATIHYAGGEDVKDFGTIGENLNWFIDNDYTLTINQKGEMPDFTSQEEGAPADNTPWREYNNSVKKVVIADGITRVGNNAFAGLSNLSEVIIANSVTSIGSYAFANTTSLKSVTLPDSLIKIESGAFGYSGLKSVNFGKSIETIETYAFFDTYLNRIVFPGSIKTIESYAFAPFFSLINRIDVYYYGTEQDWKNISVSNHAFKQLLSPVVTYNFLYREFLLDGEKIIIDMQDDAVFACNGKVITSNDVVVSVNNSVNTEAHLDMIDEIYSSYFACDISFKDVNGDEVVMKNGVATINIPFPEGVNATNFKYYGFTLYRFLNETTVEKVDCTATENGISFDASSFGTFILTTKTTIPASYIFKVGDVDAYSIEFDFWFKTLVPCSFDSGSTYVPFRYLAIAAGAKDIKFDADTGEVTIINNKDMTFVLTMGETACTYTYGGQTYNSKLNYAPKYIDHVCCLPIRDVANITFANIQFAEVDSEGYVIVCKNSLTEGEITTLVDAYEAL